MKTGPFLRDHEGIDRKRLVPHEMNGQFEAVRQELLKHPLRLKFCAARG